MSKNTRRNRGNTLPSDHEDSEEQTTEDPNTPKRGKGRKRRSENESPLRSSPRSTGTLATKSKQTAVSVNTGSDLRIVVQEQDSNNNATIKSLRGGKIRKLAKAKGGMDLNESRSRVKGQNMMTHHGSSSKTKDQSMTHPIVDIDDITQFDNMEGDNVQVDVNPLEDDLMGGEEYAEDNDPNGDSGQDLDPNKIFSYSVDEQGSESEVTFPRKKQMVQLDENDPALQKLVNKLVNEKLQIALSASRNTKDGTGKTAGLNTNMNLISDSIGSTPKTPRMVVANKVKSPSDTTIYAPALNRNCVQSNQIGMNLTNLANGGNQANQDNNDRLLHQISNFVENIRLETPLANKQKPDVGPISVQDQMEAGPSGDNPPAISEAIQQERDMDEARKTADKLILEAEQFKASIAPKSGMKPLCDIVNEKMDSETYHKLFDQIQQSLVDPDDEFFHITCHIEPALKSKIEKGEFVDLDKLLPKTRTQVIKDDRRLQFFYKDGESFFAPPDSSNKINSVRRWEQAFRVYAAIYSSANPTRSSEIWQYVFVINKAASSFTWENVYFYDITFRHLMEKNPSRSWAKTYTQMWNLAMCDRINRNQGGFQNSWNQGKRGSFDSSTPNKPRYCWKFNKNRPHNADCEFIHKCSVCDNQGHSRVDCPKRKKGNNGNQGGNGSGQAASTN